MSYETFYDRTTGNITGISQIQSITYSPVYGSKVSFQSISNIYETHNSYYNQIPLSANSLTAKFDLKFDLPETDAMKLVNFVERKQGHLFIEFDDASNFYKPVTGTCDSYGVNHINKNHYEVALVIDVTQAPTLLNWSGMTFIDKPLSNWTNSFSYKKYDVVYTGINSSKLNNFFYCLEDHTSSLGFNDPVSNGSKWSQSFFFEPDIGLQNEVNMKVEKIEFKNSFVQKMAFKKHLSLLNLNYTFSNITTDQAKSIMHFLENKAGYRRFYHAPPSVYNRPKVFYCSNWSHTWNYENSHTIEVSLIEDPLGIIPKSS